MPDDRVQKLLQGLSTIRGQRDVDLLLFFFRHPNALLPIETLAAAVGHDPGRVEESVQGLVEAGLVTRVKGRLAAHSFVFRPTAQDSVAALLQIASSRSGRLALLDALKQRKA